MKSRETVELNIGNYRRERRLKIIFALSWIAFGLTAALLWVTR